MHLLNDRCNVLYYGNICFALLCFNVWSGYQLLKIRMCGLLSTASIILKIAMCGLVISCYLLKIAVCGLLSTAIILRIAMSVLGILLLSTLLKISMCVLAIRCYSIGLLEISCIQNYRLNHRLSLLKYVGYPKFHFTVIFVRSSI